MLFSYFNLESGLYRYSSPKNSIGKFIASVLFSIVGAGAIYYSLLLTSISEYKIIGIISVPGVLSCIFGLLILNYGLTGWIQLLNPKLRESTFFTYHTGKMVTNVWIGTISLFVFILVQIFLWNPSIPRTAQNIQTTFFQPFFILSVLTIPFLTTTMTFRLLDVKTEFCYDPSNGTLSILSVNINGERFHDVLDENINGELWVMPFHYTTEFQLHQQPSNSTSALYGVLLQDETRQLLLQTGSEDRCIKFGEDLKALMNWEIHSSTKTIYLNGDRLAAIIAR